MGKLLKDFWYEEDGVGVIEIILILVILVMLIVIFRDKLTDIVEKAFSNISSGTGKINEDMKIK